MKPDKLHTRLKALVIGIVLAACACAAVAFAAPSQTEANPSLDYGYVYSGAKSASVPFVEAAMDERSLLMFGSSEFSTPARLVGQVPSQVFGKHDYGLHLMLIGEAFDQSLWHAIALGAYAREGIPRDKVVIFVGPGWFADGGMDADTFATRFSYALYRGFCSNELVGDETKAYVRERLASLGIADTQLDAAAPTLPQDHLNALAFDALEDIKAGRALDEVRIRGIELASGGPEQPDFEKLHSEALAEAAEKSTTNDWGLEDAFYTEQLEPVLEDAADSRTDETYADTREYDDFDCFLDIADACGLDVLVVVQPECGPYYDHIGISAETRKGCYDRIRAIVAQHEATIADFSDREYEPYFLYDIVHFGWTGWVAAEQSIWDFVAKEA